MNTRIQVEHPVTEMITGIDLVSEQIRVAGGHCLSFGQEDVSPTGHAIECRICAEDPASDFDPRPGAVSLFRMPEGSGIRVDHAVGSGFSVSHRFDSMIAKVIVHADTREKAIGKMVAALDQTRVHGVETTRDFIRETLLHPGFTDASFHTDFIREHGPAINRNLDHQKAVAPDPVFRAAFQALGPEKPGVSVPSPEPGPWSALGSWRLLRSKVLEYRGTTRRVTPVLAGEELNGAADCSIHPDGSVWVSAGGFNYRLTEPLNTRVAGNRAMDGASVRKPEDTGVFAPLPGLLSRVMVNPGDAVAEGDVLAIIESMKTENRILAASGGKIGAILASEGQQVALNQRILEIEIN
jgi:acetyl/propionyl-CoA carboxylase alpha subunit